MCFTETKAIFLTVFFDRESQAHPIVAYDSARYQECMFSLVPNGVFGDNPQQSEECSHIGLNGNHMCHGCKVGGTTEHKTSDDGYHSLYCVSLISKLSEVCLTA